MKAFFNQLFDYNFQCNKKLIGTCLELKAVPDDVVRLFSHILNAHHIWNARMLGVSAENQVWQLHETQNWGELHYENQRNSFEIITNTENFEKRIDYESTEGQRYSNSLQDILFHIINHSTHHRAQISAVFRANGIEPLPMDYIIYKR
ncbi:DinB family protein [Lentiprolixibacter aurantiacus]|uniref:Damage-inducible protein DinB n=1 Tax=Lentiprolixibacter aurantiacus TaxID=2993939 RepID=A0AAE3MK55_9FLAO|nr:DinB family protein [Lentiprolixibacter aurantiacus]MCX2718703.1 damage-inducible protein DinB [Lentiprolixibacter aurantiacus]